MDLNYDFFDPQIGAVVMGIQHVDELIAELIGYRDLIERENTNGSRDTNG